MHNTVIQAQTSIQIQNRHYHRPAAPSPSPYALCYGVLFSASAKLQPISTLQCELRAPPLSLSLILIIMLTPITLYVRHGTCCFCFSHVPRSKFQLRVELTLHYTVR